MGDIKLRLALPWMAMGFRDLASGVLAAPRYATLHAHARASAAVCCMRARTRERRRMLYARALARAQKEQAEARGVRFVAVRCGARMGKRS